MARIKPTVTVVECIASESKSYPRSGGTGPITDYYVTVISREVWPDGRVYRLTHTYIRPEPYTGGAYYGQRIASMSGPWID